jgi:hypothetical protein
LIAATIQQIVRQDWSVDQVARGSFEDILEALRRIWFKMTPPVDECKVAELVAMVDPSAAAKPSHQFQFPPSLKKREQFAVPDGMVGHLLRECGGNVHDRHVVDVTSGSWKSELVVEGESERPRAEAA